MKIIPIEVFQIKAIGCCGERITNVAEASTVKCPKCGSIYDKNGNTVFKVEKVNGKTRLSI